MKRGIAVAVIALVAAAALAGFCFSVPDLARAAEADKMPDDVANRLVDLTACIAHLEKTGNLVRVTSEVNPVHELAGIAKKYEG
jgi:hypothetical protein